MAGVAMKGRELIEVAHSLSIGKPPTQPRARSAVSRAYYAAFGELSDHLRVRGYATPPRKSPHDAAWNHLRNGLVDSDRERQALRQAVADTGFRLKARRQKADYQLNAQLAANEATLAVEEAKRIVNELAALAATSAGP